MRSLAAWLAASIAAAAIGAVATRQAPAFYAQLARPDWAPPGWLFAPVWTTRLPIYLFVAQLVLNALWTWLFFAWRQGAAAFGEIVILLALIAATTGAFWRVDRVAGALLVPYLLWVGYATALTYAVWRANPQLLG